MGYNKKKIIHSFNYWNLSDNFRYCKKMNPKNVDVKIYKRQKILKKQKIQSLQIIEYIYMCVCVCVCVCDYTVEKYILPSKE